MGPTARPVDQLPAVAVEKHRGPTTRTFQASRVAWSWWRDSLAGDEQISTFPWIPRTELAAGPDIRVAAGLV